VGRADDGDDDGVDSLPGGVELEQPATVNPTMRKGAASVLGVTEAGLMTSA